MLPWQSSGPVRMSLSDKPGNLFLLNRKSSPYSLSPDFIWHAHCISYRITQSSSDFSTSCDLSHLQSPLINTVLRGLGHSQVSSVFFKLWCTSQQDQRHTHSITYKWRFGQLPLDWCPIQKLPPAFYIRTVQPVSSPILAHTSICAPL
jgi:hypothetical protein